MEEESEKSEQLNFLDSGDATSLPGSRAGNSPFNSQDGPKIDPSGQAPVPASRFHKPEGAGALLMSDTCGLFGENLSASAVLQRCLDSRLVARMAEHGSLEYALTWKRWDMPSGPPICALRASMLRTSDRDFGGWPTPKLPSGGGQATRQTPIRYRSDLDGYFKGLYYRSV